MPGRAGPWKKALPNKKDSVKKCPHCDTSLPEGASRCPACGAQYWEPSLRRAEEIEEETDQEEEGGCLPILILPVVLAVGITGALVLLGFLIHLFVHFPSYQVKVVWLGLSLLIGLGVYKLFAAKRRR